MKKKKNKHYKPHPPAGEGKPGQEGPGIALQNRRREKTFTTTAAFPASSRLLVVNTAVYGQDHTRLELI